MTGPDFASRVAGVRAALEGAGVDALLITDLTNVRYLTGYAGSNGLVAVTPEGATFMTDFRYVTAAEPISRFMSVLMLEGETAKFLGEHLGEIAPGAKRIGIEGADVTVDTHGRLAAAFGETRELVATDGVVEYLRLIKDGYEQEAVRRSAALIAPVYEAIAAEGLGGKREIDVAWRIQELFHEQGAEGLSFDSIVASHERGAMPHADPGENVISEGTLVTIDLGCVLDGYASDCTRTFSVGEPDADLAEIYAICLEAQIASLAAVKAGAICRDVDAVARDIIAAAGHGDHFGHGLGHGVGLAIHEGPRLSASSDATLEAGMVVTVEPGIYLPGRGGVRIEDLTIVTESGAERLTPYPKELQLVG